MRGIPVSVGVLWVPVFGRILENIIHFLMKIGVRQNLPESGEVRCALMVFGVFRKTLFESLMEFMGLFGVLGGLRCFRTFQGLMESLHKQVRIPLKSRRNLE